MTIRFTCAECASVLKIKDELAGTSARCPKCKTKFVVPAATSDERSPVVELPTNQALSSETANSEPKEDGVGNASLPSNSDEQSDRDLVAKPSDALLFSTPLASPSEPNVVSVMDEAPLAEAPLSDDDSDSSNALTAPPSIDDSNDEEEILPKADEATEGGNPQADGNSPPFVFEDDDLDSPPLMVGAAPAKPLSDSNLNAMGVKDVENARPPIKNSTKSPKSASTTPKEDQFDPLKFLMADSPAQKRNSLPSNMQADSDLSLSDDSDYDLLSRPSPHPLTRATPVAASSRSTPEKVDLVTAAKMMKKAIKESSAEAAHQRQLDAKAGFDYFLIFREIGLRGLAKLVGLVVVVVACVYLGNYLFSPPRLKTPKLGFVRGTVKLDGQPLAGAQVYLAPRDLTIEGTKRERARTSLGVTDKSGFFKMMYTSDIEGVAVGKCRYWVSHFGPQGEEVPPDWTEGKMRECEVTEGQQKVPFDIVMESGNAGSKK